MALDLRPEQLIIVKRDRPGVLAVVQARYGDARRSSWTAGTGRVGVTFRPVRLERREVKDRRRPLLPVEDSMWNEAHYRIALRSPGAPS